MLHQPADYSSDVLMLVFLQLQQPRMAFKTSLILARPYKIYRYDIDSRNKHNNEAWFQGNKPSTFNESLH
jgi:hypothetical protein